jgi:hypothetical protein
MKNQNLSVSELVRRGADALRAQLSGEEKIITEEGRVFWRFRGH